MIAVEVGQVVVVVFGELGKLPMPETTPTPGTHARLRADNRSGQDVIASVPELPIAAAAGLITGGVGDGVFVLAVQARDGVAAAAVASGDLVETLLGEHEGPKLAGVGDGARLRYSHG